MNKSNVYSSAKIVNSDDSVQDFQLGTFVNNQAPNEPSAPPVLTQPVSETATVNMEPLLNEIRNIGSQLNQIDQRITNVENGGMTAREIDAQVLQAIKDLKNYAAFFEQATFQMETKVLRTSISIAKKIIDIELGENSVNIARQTITHLLEKIKNASKIKIHLNPKDYEGLKDQLNLENSIELLPDPNVAIGGVVIASDLGNFDGNIEAKVSTMLESLDTVI